MDENLIYECGSEFNNYFVEDISHCLYAKEAPRRRRQRVNVHVESSHMRRNWFL